MPLAVTFPLSGRFGDFHPLEYVRAGRTKKTAIEFTLLRFSEVPSGIEPLYQVLQTCT